MKTALITGGSSGIGYEMSKHFAQNNFRILWVAKPPEELESAAIKIKNELEKVELYTFARDLSKEAAAQEVWDWTRENNWEIDVLINNAGIGNHGFADEIPLEKELQVIQLNIIAVFQLTRLFLAEMKKRNIGTIINISSNSSFQPVARMNTYASTKAFITHFSRGLEEELRLQGSKVKVMTVCPSAIKDTAFKVQNNMQQVKTFEGIAYTTAEEVAKDVWNGFIKNKSFIVTGFKMRMLYAIRGLIPYSIQQFLVRRETELESK